MNLMEMRFEKLIGVLVVILVAFLGSTLRAEDKPAEKPASKAVEKITIEQFEEKAKEKDVVILDVRSPEEFKEGHVPGATNVNVSDEKFAEKVEALGKDKSILVYCRSGKRSTVATEKMSKMGFEKLYNFVGSMNEWTAAKKPVEKGDEGKK
jgi:phage shock protein E